MDNIIHLFKQDEQPETVPCETPEPVALPKPPEVFAKYAKRPLMAKLCQAITSTAQIVSYRAKRIGKEQFKNARHAVYRQLSKGLVGKITDLAVQLNRPDFHVIVSYSGHVDSIHLDIHLGGWKYEEHDKRRVRLLSGALPGHRRHATMRPKDLRHAMAAMNALSRLSYDDRRSR